MIEETECIFCSEDNSGRVFIDDDLGYARWDKNPVSLGHALIIPRRHVLSFFELETRELIDLYELLQKAKRQIDGLHKPDGYNIGINQGSSAGQTVEHLHIHLIPRYKGDVPEPRGGIRHVIPDKANYPQ
jgi:diadenosine tetraphosphate (Ap4A) HIT family hydrolase